MALRNFCKISDSPHMGDDVNGNFTTIDTTIFQSTSLHEGRLH